ncbi:MAG: glycosyltransferase family 2 protein [Candidatus Pelagibacter sp.]
MVKKPEISIVMNCHNGEKFLVEAIKSVLNQSYKKWELIFWNNSSKDDSEKIFKSFKDKRLRYFYTSKKVSLYVSRNAAVKKARGNFIAFLDVDDIWLPNKLKLQLKKFKDAKVGLVYGKFIKFNKDSLFRKKQFITKKNLPEGYITKELLENYPVGLLTIMIRKKFIKNKQDIFKVKYNYLGDLDFVLRFSLKHKFAAVQECVGIYRQHDNQMQKKNFKLKSFQFSKWYKEITSKKVFGSIENYKLLTEWERFHSSLTMVKEKKNLKVLKKIIEYPNNFNKLKLFILFFLPEFISRRLIGET